MRPALVLSILACAGSVHPEREAQIKEINETPGVMWKAAANTKFAELAPGANKKIYGVKGDWKKDIGEAVERGEIQRSESAYNAAIPDDFDSLTAFPQCAKVINDILDQSNCGCCWAFAGAKSASVRMCIASNGSMEMPLSPQDICFNSNYDGCDGGQISTPWSYIKRTGVVTGGDVAGKGEFGTGWCSKFSLPHCHHHGPQRDDPYPAENAPGCPSASSPDGPTACDSDAKSPHDNFKSDKYTFSGRTISASGEEEIQRALMAGGPMEVAFTVYSDFENYASGIYHHVTGEAAGGHAVTMTGWGVEDGVKYWKVQNSWNPYWGEHGYFRIRRGNNEGGIEDEAVASSPSSTWSKKSEQIKASPAVVV
jgi:hypothetical protein